MGYPSVYYFNPTCELAVANGSFSYNPPKLLQKFEDDCSVIPFAFGTSNDYVLTKNPPSKNFLRRMADLGFELPQFFPLDELVCSETDKFEALYPWGWSPAAHFYLKDLKPRCIYEFQKSPVFNWTNNQLLLFERITSLNFLNDFLKKNQFDFLIETENIGRKVATIKEIETLVNEKKQLVLKAPLSSSGRGIQIIRKPILNESNKQWISGILNQQNYLIAEPFLVKENDFSFQFKISKDRIDYLGYTVFETNSNGQYKNTSIHPKIAGRVKEDLLIELTAVLLKEELKNSVYGKFHRGFLGIDGMSYREGGDFKIQPCIEINSRMNMGILANQLERLTHGNSTGKFELFFGSKGEYLKFATEKSNQKQLKTENGKLISGFLSMTEPNDETQFGAYLEIGTVK